MADSAYLVPESRAPYSGRVFRMFESEPSRVQLEGALLDGVWDGDLVVYHPNGRVRYFGTFVRGERCGAWTENADSVAVESVYDELVREIETMGLYPSCESLRDSETHR